MRGFLLHTSSLLSGVFLFGRRNQLGPARSYFKTSVFFEEHNSQDEENIHNLVLDGEKLNKIIFTDALVAGVAIYLVGFPLLYGRNQRFKQFMDDSAIPIPRLYQIIGSVLVFGLSFLTFDSKGAELLELGGSTMFLLIVLYPLNSDTRFLPK